MIGPASVVSGERPALTEPTTLPASGQSRMLLSSMQVDRFGYRQWIKIARPPALPPHPGQRPGATQPVRSWRDNNVGQLPNPNHIFLRQLTEHDRRVSNPHELDELADGSGQRLVDGVRRCPSIARASSLHDPDRHAWQITPGVNCQLDCRDAEHRNPGGNRESIGNCQSNP